MTKPHELAPATMLRYKDQSAKEISNSLAGLYSTGYRLLSVTSFDTELDGKRHLLFSTILSDE